MKAQIITSLSTSFKQKLNKMRRVFNILFASLLLSSCIFSDNRAPVIDLSRNSVIKQTPPNSHIVKPGETLYAIAWRYGLDYKNLAKANGIGSDYSIFVGQTLYLKSQTNLSSKSTSLSDSPNTYSSSTSTNRSTKTIATPSQSVSRKETISSSRSSVSNSRSEKKSSIKKPVTISKSPSGVLQWHWPSKGRVITNFSKKNVKNRGIDILGKKGDSVLAAASGTVVYAGSGLRAYGKLIIIKHNDTYLSAYAHNDRIRVKEGQKVKAGQHIADIGSSGSRADQAKLHFEIRRNGQPINPLALLPKRKT